MSMFKLTKTVSIITGASKGIGKSIAEYFADAGSHVVCVSRSEKSLIKVQNKIINNGGHASIYACDVSILDDVTSLINDTINNFKQIDILINNAGITRDGLIMRMAESDWDEVLNINLKGAFNTIKKASPQMMKQRSGRIINISSIVGIKGNAGQANYSASKAGLIGLTKSTAKELAPRSITVNCIAPGYIDTDMTDKISESSKQELMKKIPNGKIGKPNNIASAALFLASNEAEYITGQTISVDGGLLIN